MKILVLESSGLVASVAVVTEEKLIGEYTTNFKKTHSQILLPMMDTLLKMIGIPVQDGCYCRFRRSGVFYGIKNRFGNSQGPWTGVKYSDYQCTNSRCHCI